MDRGHSDITVAVSDMYKCRLEENSFDIVYRHLNSRLVVIRIRINYLK